MYDPFSKDWSKAEPEPKKNAYADITIVFDRSGSMDTMKNDVIGGFNRFVQEMREKPGDNKWTLVQFDDYNSAKGANEPFPQILYEQRSEKDIPLLTDENFQPRGGTALVDAVCKTIKSTQARTSGQDAKVIMMIVTDGEENSSVEYSTPKLREMIAETQEKGWNYIYLGANQDAFAVAGSYGMNQLMNYAGLTGVSGIAPSSSTPFSAAVSSGAIGSGLVGVFAIASGSTTPGKYES